MNSTRPTTQNDNNMPNAEELIAMVRLYEHYEKGFDIPPPAQPESMPDTSMLAQINAYWQKGSKYMVEKFHHITGQDVVDQKLLEICSGIKTQVKTLKEPQDWLEYLLTLPKLAQDAQHLKSKWTDTGISRCYLMIHAVMHHALLTMCGGDFNLARFEEHKDNKNYKPENELKFSQERKSTDQELKTSSDHKNQLPEFIQVLIKHINKLKIVLDKKSLAKTQVLEKTIEGNWETLYKEENEIFVQLCHLHDSKALATSKERKLLESYQNVETKEKDLIKPSHVRKKTQFNLALPYQFQVNFDENWYEDHFRGKTQQDWTRFLQEARVGNLPWLNEQENRHQIEIKV